MISIKTSEEIKMLREGGGILAFVLHKLSESANSDIPTIELDALAEKLIRRANGEPSFKNYKIPGDKISYPASLCVSINDEIVHGLPTKNKILKQGDIVGLDLGMKYKGLYTDMAITVPVGRVSEKAQKIIEVTKKCLDEGIGAIKEGAFIGNIGFAIQQCAESQRFNVVKKLAGHGVGNKVHEKPEIPNYGVKGEGAQLKAGMVLALEPILAEGASDVVLDKNGWAWKTKDGSLSAHFEHTVAVTKSGAEVLTLL